MHVWGYNKITITCFAASGNMMRMLPAAGAGHADHGSEGIRMGEVQTIGVRDRRAGTERNINTVWLYENL